MYSSVIRAHAVRPQWRGPLIGANAQGESRYHRCGDSFLLQLRVEDGAIAAAGFQAQACAPVVAMGSVGCGLLRGLSLDQARQLSAFALDDAMGGLPVSKRHAILLFLDSLHTALTDYSRAQNQLIQNNKENLSS